MNKIPTIFVRHPANPRLVSGTCNPECFWVFRGEGRATCKYDGTACLVQDGRFYKRREVKPNKPVPPDFREVEQDLVTGKRFGWVPVTDEDRWHLEAIGGAADSILALPDGTYELLGPKVQGNAESNVNHVLLSHSLDVHVYEGVPRAFSELRHWLSSRDIEGLVFQHPDGRMAKIKKRDFGLSRSPCAR